MEKPLILITNDDGISADGLQALCDALSEIGEIVVVAPAEPNSGVSHAVTLRSTLWLRKTDAVSAQRAYACSGTPVDSVKLALRKVLDRKPDLLVSGINHGSNSSINVIYSGTMAAAIEGALEGIPSVGFSILDHSEHPDFNAAKKYALRIASQVLEDSLPEGICLNVNIPSIPEGEIRGIRVCRQARATWIEDFDTRCDPGGREYHWMTGQFNNLDEGKDTDEWALKNKFVSIVPIKHDLTAREHLPTLSDSFKHEVVS